MLKGVLHWLDDAVGVNHFNAMTTKPFLDALIRIASPSRKAVYDPEHEIIHPARILFYVIENVVQDWPLVFSPAESFAEYRAVRDYGKSPVGHEFPADALLRIKAFAFLGRFRGAYAAVNYAVFVIGLRHKKQERGNDAEHNVEKTLNIATPS